MTECPECGEAYKEREVWDPQEGPNKTSSTVIGYIHDEMKLCTVKQDD